MSTPLSDRAIAVDATLWDEPTTGIGLVTRETVKALGSHGVSVERWGARKSGEAPRGHQGRTLWTLGTLPALMATRNPKLFHAFGNFNLPLVKAPGQRWVLTVHDLIPLVLPDSVSLAFGWQFRLWLSRSLTVADHVICISDATRADVLARFPDIASKISVVRNGVDHVARNALLDSTAESYLHALALPPKFALFAGAWDARKNITAVLDAWERVGPRLGVPLVLVGQPWFGSGTAEDRVAQMRARGLDVRPLGFQPSALLYALMKRATVFLFPSLYEGFGLPPLEAMFLGTPAIVSTASSLPEVCGDAALQVPPRDVAALAHALEHLLTHESEREARRLAGQAHAQRFTWARAASTVADIYRHLLEREA